MFSQRLHPLPQLLKIIPEKQYLPKTLLELRYPLKTLLLLLLPSSLSHNSLLSLVSLSRTFQRWQMETQMMNDRLSLKPTLLTGARSTSNDASGNCARTKNTCRFGR